MLSEFQQIFHSITKSLEVLYVIEGIKPCARILVFEDELDKVMNFLSEKNVHTFISDFKVLKQNMQSEFYSDKSIKIQKDSPQKGHFFVYLSKNVEIAQNASIMEEENNHKELGLLLGYPQCCCDFFADNFNEKNTDLTLEILKNSDGFEFDFYNNICARHFDVGLLGHFPHSFKCKPSIEIAKSNLKIIKKRIPELADLFVKNLQSAVIYTSEEGIFLLRKYEKIGNEIIYGDLLTTTKNKMYYLLSSNKKLEIVDKNSFIVDEININGKGYGVMVFS